MTTAAVDGFVALAAALGLELDAPLPERPGGARRYNASGTVDGFAVSLGRMWSRDTAIPICVETITHRDLRLELFTRRPRHVFQQIDAELRGGLWVRGNGDRERLGRLLDGAVGDHLAALAALHVHVDDRAVRGFLASDAADLVGEARRLIALAAAVDDAATRMPVDPALAWAEPRFAAAAAALGLTFLPCALGLRGELDGCRITTHHLWSRGDRRLLIHVALPQLIPGQWAVRGYGRAWWQRVRGAVTALGGRGPGSGRFAFDRRFYVDGDRAIAFRAVAAHLDPLIDFVDRNWLSVSGSLVLLGFRLRESMPDLVELLPRAVAMAHRIAGAPRDAAPAGPFR